MMKMSDEEFEDWLRFELAAEGFIFPTTDAEMEAFEERHKDYQLKNPPGSVSAEEILKRYYSNKPKK